MKAKGKPGGNQSKNLLSVTSSKMQMRGSKAKLQINAFDENNNRLHSPQSSSPPKRATILSSLQINNKSVGNQVLKDDGLIIERTVSFKGITAEIKNSNIDDAETKTKLDFEIPVITQAENTDNIKVIARFRPLNSLETDLFNRGMGGICVKYNKRDGCTISNTVGFAQSYTFDRVFDANTSQQSLFEEAAKPVIDDILKGYNGTIFTYGQSGSGKTHTMYGSSLYDEVQKGIIPRSIEYMFDFINDPKNEGIKFQIKFSMLEIYKEMLYDLLNPEISSKDLKIKETKDKQIYVTNLTEEYISNIEEFLLLIDQADQYRVVSETGLNKQSSRSHLLFIIEVLQQLPDGSEKCGKLNLIDLAGSEKVAKTGAVGEMLEEAKKINLSLSTLGMVISSLSTEKDYIPYRDSKLTRILQDSLGGNYKTTLIVACSPHVFNSEESNATLKFALRAKKIKNKVKQNIKKSTEELEKIIENLSEKLTKAKSEIARLKSKLKQLPQSVKEEYNIEEILEKIQPDQKEEPSNTANLMSTETITRVCSDTVGLEEATEDKVEIDDFADPAVLYNSEIQSKELDGIELKERNDSSIMNISMPLDNMPEKLKVKSRFYKTNDMSTDQLEASSLSCRGQFCESPANENEMNQSVLKKNTEESEKKKDSTTRVFESKEYISLFNRYEKAEEMIAFLKKEIEKITSCNINYREANIHLKEQVITLIKSSENLKSLDLTKMEDLLRKLDETCKDVIIRFLSLSTKGNEEISKNLQEENQSLKKKIMQQEEEYLSLFKKVKLFENETFICEQIEGVDNSKNNFGSFNSGAKDIFNFRPILAFNRSFFREVMHFFSYKHEFFKNDLYCQGGTNTKDLEKAKNNNTKTAFIK